MFDIGLFEMLLVLLLGLVVLGPERLPEAARMIGAWFNKAKRTMNDVRVGVEREVKAHELSVRIKSELEKAGLDDVRDELQKQESLLREQLFHGEQSNHPTPSQAKEPPRYREAPEGHDPIASAPSTQQDEVGQERKPHD